MAQKTSTSTPQKEPSRHSSRTGALLSVLAFIMAALGYAIANSHYKAQTPVTNASERAGELIAQGTSRSLAVILSMPLLVAAIGLAILAVVLTVLRLRKVKVAGAIASVIWLAISIWAAHIALVGFQLIRAH